MYLGGGIAPKILKIDAETGSLRKAFLDKGRLSPLLEAMPVRIILDETLARCWGRRRLRRRGLRSCPGVQSGPVRRSSGVGKFWPQIYASNSGEGKVL
jgi:hypothetical protein